MTKDYVNEKLELIKKMMEIKHEFHQIPIKKTGKNNYRNYKYFRLEDFIPYVEELCYKHKVFTKYKVNEDGSMLHLTVTDCDTGFTDIIASMRLPQNVNSNINDCCQDEGKIRKYLRRYLWSDALDLVEDDEIEVTAGMKQHRQQTDKKNKPKKSSGSNKISREECERLKKFAQEVQKELRDKGLNPDRIEVMEQGLDKHVISKEISVNQKNYILGLMTA